MESLIDSLGNEPFEVLGFDDEEEMENALSQLMEQVQTANFFKSFSKFF